MPAHIKRRTRAAAARTRAAARLRAFSTPDSVPLITFDRPPAHRAPVETSPSRASQPNSCVPHKGCRNKHARRACQPIACSKKTGPHHACATSCPRPPRPRPQTIPSPVPAAACSPPIKRTIAGHAQESAAQDHAPRG
eukprot:5419865-Pleurochrysis_carterae.AAC.1